MNHQLTKNSSFWLILGASIALIWPVSLLFDVPTLGYTSWILTGVLAIGFALFFEKRWLYILAVASIPISIGVEAGDSGINVSLPSEGFELLLLLLALAFAVFKSIDKKLLKHPLTVLLFIDIGWLFVTSLTSTLPDVSLKRWLIKTTFFVVFYLLFAEWTKNAPKKSFKLFLAYAVGLLAPMLLILKNHARYDFDPKVVFSISQPYYAEHTVYGACLAFIIPPLIMAVVKAKELKITTGWRWFLGAVLILVVTSEILALSRASLLSLLVALIFLILTRYKIQIKTLIVFLLLFTVGVLSFRNQLYNYFAQTEAVSNDGNVVNHVASVTNVQTDASNLERINRWICAWEMFKEKPLTGFGPGTYQFEYANFQIWEYKTYISTTHGDRGNAHSEYLSYLAETGFFGFIIFTFMVFYSLHLGLKNYYAYNSSSSKYVLLSVLLGLVTFYFHGIFNAFSDQDEMAFLYLGALATIYTFDQKSRNRLSTENLS